MAICISGDLDPDSAFTIIEKYFGEWKKPKSLRPEPKWEEKPLQGREFVQVEYLGEEQVVSRLSYGPPPP